MQQAQHFLSVQNRLGEGSFWNASEQKLYWIDIYNKRFYRMDTRTRDYETFEAGVEIGVMAPCQDARLIMATRQGFARWDFTTSHLQLLINPITQEMSYKRFNDGNVDARGRFWAGTMCDPVDACKTPQCKLYRYDPDGSLYLMDTDLGMPNGLVWSPDNSKMYLTDSNQQTIFQYDFDLETGTIQNRRPFVQTQDEPGVPDGLTIDSEGYLWSVRYNGSKIIRYDPDGKVEREISIPVPHPTSCTFGGEHMNELYITTCWNELSLEQRTRYPESGDLFYLQTDIQGMARNTFASEQPSHANKAITVS